MSYTRFFDAKNLFLVSDWPGPFLENIGRFVYSAQHKLVWSPVWPHRWSVVRPAVQVLPAPPSKSHFNISYGGDRTADRSRP